MSLLLLFRGPMTFTATPSDTVAVANTVARVGTFLRPTTDTATASDAVARAGTFLRTTADTVTASNVVARVGTLLRTTADSVTAGNTVARVAGLFRRIGTGEFDPAIFDPDVFDTWGDRVSLSASVARAFIFIRTLADTLSISDAISAIATAPRGDVTASDSTAYGATATDTGVGDVTADDSL